MPPLSLPPALPRFLFLHRCLVQGAPHVLRRCRLGGLLSRIVRVGFLGRSRVGYGGSAESEASQKVK